ncbi:MAG: FAD-binding oxidoreductase [Mycobacteriales bacterium]
MSTYRVWGWGTSDSDAPRAADVLAFARGLESLLGFAGQAPEEPAALRPLPESRIVLPSSLAALGSAEPIDRARHGLGRSYRDVIRGVRGAPEHLPDLVVRPGVEGDVAAVLDWAAEKAVAVVPFGGGSSVVGGVEPAVGEDFRGTISLDLRRLAGVVEVDPTAQAARLLAGTTGPDVEAGLDGTGLTLRFFPQSFERSTVGGWIATRAAGHYAARLQHIDDLVEAVRAVTPSGVWESRRLPGSGAGPSPDRLLLGSEGALGVVTEAWLRLQRRPAYRARAMLAAPDLVVGAHALRMLVQQGLAPATCRLLDAREAALTGTLSTGEAALVLGAESATAPVDSALQAAVAACADLGLRPLPRHESAAAGDSWRSAFLRAPYLRELFVLSGVLVETFETAVTWERLTALVDAVTAATRTALGEVCGGGTVTCRITHAYPDGAAPYFTVLAPARRGGELSQWADIEAAAKETLHAAGGSITHHHAVGRDHRRWYDRQRPEPFALALAAAKDALDPAGILNPGVLLDRHPPPGQPPASTEKYGLAPQGDLSV